MTATRPASRYNHVNQQSNNNSNVNNVLAKRTRGPINKRACQRCRQGKIKCDGDAETGKPCSNCDPQHCKYDNSPRKNKQVESLKLRLNAVEEQLIAITSDVSEQLQTKDIEKEILCLLYESKEHFVSYEPLFEGLRDALKQSRCIRPVLPITFELLKRLGGERNHIPDIMKSLQRFVDCANSDAQLLPAFPSSDMFKKIEENYLAQPYQTGENIFNDEMMMQPISLPLNNDMNHINLQSGDDEGGSDSGVIEYTDDTTSGDPTTPPNNGQQQIHPESKRYNSSPNNVSQHPTPIVTTTTASEFFYDSYPPFYNVMESNYAMNAMNTMNFLPPTTTSPTDEQMTSWSLNSN
jgi:hypothetical protein